MSEGMAVQSEAGNPSQSSLTRMCEATVPDNERTITVSRDDPSIRKGVDAVDLIKLPAQELTLPVIM
jgi:hypothetical protein